MVSLQQLHERGDAKDQDEAQDVVSASEAPLLIDTSVTMLQESMPPKGYTRWTPALATIPSSGKSSSTTLSFFNNATTPSTVRSSSSASQIFLDAMEVQPGPSTSSVDSRGVFRPQARSGQRFEDHQQEGGVVASAFGVTQAKKKRGLAVSGSQLGTEPTNDSWVAPQQQELLKQQQQQQEEGSIPSAATTLSSSITPRPHDNNKTRSPVANPLGMPSLVKQPGSSFSLDPIASPSPSSLSSSTSSRQSLFVLPPPPPSLPPHANSSSTTRNHHASLAYMLNSQEPAPQPPPSSAPTSSSSKGKQVVKKETTHPSPPNAAHVTPTASFSAPLLKKTTTTNNNDMMVATNAAVPASTSTSAATQAPPGSSGRSGNGPDASPPHDWHAIVVGLRDQMLQLRTERERDRQIYRAKEFEREQRYHHIMMELRQTRDQLFTVTRNYQRQWEHQRQHQQQQQHQPHQHQPSPGEEKNEPAVATKKIQPPS
ncbi:hypothetical protein BC940DRAFT_301203, partial [Gongronella butleri]